MLELSFTEFLARIDWALRGPLPGRAAHALLEPQPRRTWAFNPEDARPAAGLILLFPVAERPHLVLTVRSNTVGRHRGQVSLPGGVIETGETVAQAALREAREEIALQTDAVRVLGTLTPLDIPVSGFRLHPVVAASEARPTLSAADGEVSRIIEVGIDALADPSHLGTIPIDRNGVELAVPAFRMEGLEIWGATAMVLAELLTVLGWQPAPL